MQDNDILGNPDLHERLCLSSCILAELLRQSPAAVGIDQLVQVACHPREEVELMCSRLSQTGLLRLDPEREGLWQLAGDPSSLTLADLFSALLVPSFGH
ncbi:hypothetical protein [Noviherbaspirillum sp. ST9]|uniref:hypothetical protein n=1 Tax=Noviherbaspirillum sp. ST9 TaxID=3401606 RepID=UPI003B5863EF